MSIKETKRLPRKLKKKLKKLGLVNHSLSFVPDGESFSIEPLLTEEEDIVKFIKVI